MLPPRPGEPLEPSCPSRPSLPLLPLGDPMPPEPPRPPRPPLPPEPPEPPSSNTVKEPPCGSTRKKLSLPCPDTPTCSKGWLPALSATRTCTGGPSSPSLPLPPSEPLLPSEPLPPALGWSGSVDPELPLERSDPELPSRPLDPSRPEKLAVNWRSYSTGISRSACRSGWLGTVMLTCGSLPSLILGSRARDTTPFLLALTMLGVTVRSFHKTLSRVVIAVPSGLVMVTMRGDFSPGAMPWPSD